MLFALAILLLALWLTQSLLPIALSQLGPDWIIPAIAGALMIFSLVGLLISTISSHKHSQGRGQVNSLARELNEESIKSDIIINAIGDGVIVADARGIIASMNPAAQQIIGWGKEDALKLDYRSVLKIIDNKDTLVTEDLDPVQQSIKRGTPIITDNLGLRTVSGKKILASILVSPLGDDNARTGTVIVFRDITAQHAEEREKAEFVSTASHEMRTPVAAIEGYLGLAINPNTATVDARAKAYLEKAHESAQHLGRLFQDLLDVTRIDDGRLKSTPMLVDVTASARSILEDFAEQFTAKGLTAVFKPDQTSGGGQPLAPIFYASIDPDHFREVYANLIENAIKYTREGTISIDVNGDAERIMVSIQDSGIGIPTEDIPHLFQKFYRVDNTDTREIGGTGLGLYLSRRLTEAMGGILSVDSKYGQGSTFTIELPRLDKQAVEAALQEASTKPEKPSILPATAAVPVAVTAAPPVTTPDPAPTPPPAVRTAAPAAAAPARPAATPAVPVASTPTVATSAPAAVELPTPVAATPAAPTTPNTI